MGESACWLHLVCHECGSVSDRLDPDGRCPTCRAATAATAADADTPGASPTPPTSPTEGDPTDV